MSNDEFDIWTAASVGDIEFIKQNVNSESVNDINLGQWSCLMYASYYDHKDLVVYLLSCGANINLRANRTSLMLAASCGHYNLVKILSTHFQDNVQDNKGKHYCDIFYIFSAIDSFSNMFLFLYFFFANFQNFNCMYPK